MQNWKDEVLWILRKQTKPISSTTLAQDLHVSSRSIKSHIKFLNEQYDNIITSTPNGYLINKEKSASMLETPLLSENRFLYFTQLFFVKHVQSISIYDVCDELFLSYSSIKLLLSKWNQQNESFHLVLRCKNDEIYLQGKEQDKRRFLTDAIFKEASGHLVDESMLYKHFPQLDILYLKTTLHSIFKEFNCYIHEFGYTNLLLHMSVILDRIRNGNAIQEDIPQINEDVHPITQRILQELTNHFHTPFNILEQQNMNELIIANINFTQGKNEKELRAIIGDDMYNMTLDIIESINARYDLHLNKETLLFPLSLHFKNLFQRTKQQTTLRNPLLTSIQASCPLLYDCAIFITNYLNLNFDIQITQDETAYLAMHIGADIEHQQKNIKKLRCALLCPDYQQNQQQIYNYLLIHFDSDITLTSVATYETDIEQDDLDIIFTTILMKHPSEKVLLIAPMKQAIDLKEVYTHIQAQLDRKKMQVLYSSFSTYFSPSLFYYDEEGSNKEEILQRLCKKLNQHQYVQSHFYYDVCKREEAASTAFGQIAIPHSMNMDASRTGICLAISPHGIRWNQQSVHLVLLIAINEHDSHLFKELYEALILLFSQEDSLSLLKRCKSFEEFATMIFQLK